MRLDANRPHTWATAAVRDAEGLVQVHVRHVGTDIRRTGQCHLGIQVGAVHIHLATILVNDVADLANALFIHAVGGGVGNHQAGQIGRVVFGFLAEIVDIHVALVITADQYYAHAGHHRRGRVGTVRRGRDQTDVAMLVAIGFMELADRQQAGILALRTRVGLHADGIEAGDLAQHGFQLVDHDLVTLGLCQGCKGMQLAKFGPGDRDHFGGGVELHGAGAQRNHCVVQRQILVLQ